MKRWWLTVPAAILALALMMLTDEASACTPLWGGAPQTLTQPGCYVFQRDIIDPISVRGPGIHINMAGRTLGCRGARGKGFDVYWGPGLIIENGVISGCDFAVNAYLNGYIGTGVTFRDLTIVNPSVRGIQVHADSVTIDNVTAMNVGPSRAPGYCLAIGIEVLGDSPLISNSTVRNVHAVGSVPSCEAVGVSITGQTVTGTIVNVTVDNRQTTPEPDKHYGVWVGGTALEVRLIEVYIHNTWHGSMGLGVRLYGGEINVPGSETQSTW